MSSKKSAAKRPAKVVAKIAKKANAKKATVKKATAKKAAAGQKLLPPEGGAVVRMYRIGHGDCFLLAFDSGTPGQPVYVLIDCGYKPGSPSLIEGEGTPSPRIDKIVRNLHEATGGVIDVAVITHEHQDHVNGITATRFADFEFRQVWLAWTEDGDDPLANALRREYHDELLGLVAARNQLGAATDEKLLVQRLSRFLSLELGNEFDDKSPGADLAAAAAGEAKGSDNKISMKVFRDKVNKPRFLIPHKKIEKLPGTEDVRVFVLGPPKDGDAIKLVEPEGTEIFPAIALARSSPSRYFAAAAIAADDGAPNPSALSPFASRYQVSWEKAKQEIPGSPSFFGLHYGFSNSELRYAKRDEPWQQQWKPVSEETAGKPAAPLSQEVADNPPWRRIDQDWLHSAMQLAIKQNNRTNNTSLVLAFELGEDGKVLLFAADALRGNWLSWAKKDWRDGDKTITAKDLLSRTVLYKAGHHCSHNGTLNGSEADEYANIGWMATGPYADEFVAMITAVKEWADDQPGWHHPFPPIKKRLQELARGRVFQTDTNELKMKKPAGVGTAEWKDFMDRVVWHDLYFDYTVNR